MPKFFRFTGPQFDGHFAYCEVRDGETPADYGLPKNAVEVDRMPGEFETQDKNGNWKKDQDGEDAAKEDRRLVKMKPSERHRDSIEKAKKELRTELAKEK